MGNRKSYYRYGKTELELIDAIYEGLLSTIASVTIFLPQTLQAFREKRGQKEFASALKRLKEKGIIVLGGEKIKLTTKGKRLQKLIKFREIMITPPSKWDRIWRLVSYDIPKKLNKERDYFRLSLRHLNFYKIHASLWVFPFECQEEIAIVAEDLGVSEYVVFMTTNHLPRQKEIERKFNLH